MKQKVRLWQPTKRRDYPKLQRESDGPMYIAAGCALMLAIWIGIVLFGLLQPA